MVFGAHVVAVDVNEDGSGKLQLSVVMPKHGRPASWPEINELSFQHAPPCIGDLKECDLWISRDRILLGHLEIACREGITVEFTCNALLGKAIAEYKDRQQQLASLPKWPMATDVELENRFLRHAPQGDQAERCLAIRAKALGLARLVRDSTPPSPEQTRAIDALDMAMMLAIAAIVRNE